MQSTLQKLVTRHLNLFHEKLLAAKERADDVDTASLNLGDSMRAKVAAATEMPSAQEAMASAVVVKKCKRAALIQVGCLLYFSNRFGVLTCLVPSGLSLECLATVWGPGIPPTENDVLLAQVGAKQTGWDRGDRVFDYSGCEEVAQAWMA